MSQSDFDNMSHKELADRIATMKDNIEAMKDELAKKTADEFEKILTEFWVKAEELGISPDRIIDAVKKSAARHAGKPSSRPQKLSKLSIKGFEKGVTYVNPADSSQTWNGGSKGPKPTWLLSQFNEQMSPEDMVQEFKMLEKN